MNNNKLNLNKEQIRMISEIENQSMEMAYLYDLGVDIEENQNYIDNKEEICIAGLYHVITELNEFKEELKSKLSVLLENEDDECFKEIGDDVDELIYIADVKILLNKIQNLEKRKEIVKKQFLNFLN